MVNAKKKVSAKKVSAKKVSAKKVSATKAAVVARATAPAKPIRPALPRGASEGVALVERCIEIVREKGFAALGSKKITKPEPVPAAALETLRFPNGERPSPSLLRWMAFDGRWLASLGWFDDPKKPVFHAVTIGAFGEREYGPDDDIESYGRFEQVLPGSFYLLPLGSDSRRALYVGKPDAIGEHPVAVTDNDELPFVGLMYPGFDVYLAHDVLRILPFELGTYTSLNEMDEYAARMAQHRKTNFGGKAYFEWDDLPERTKKPAAKAGAAPAFSAAEWKPGDPVPAGYRLAMNPFTKQPILFQKR